MAQTLLVRALGDQLGPLPDRFINGVLSDGVWDLAGDHFKVQAQASPAMSVRCGSGSPYDKAVVVGAVAGQETFVVRNEDAYVGSGNADLTIGNGDPSDPRIDLVVLSVYEDEVDSSGLLLSRVEVIPGTPAASPTVPATPAGAIALGSVLVPANESTSIETGDITDLRVQSAPSGPLGVAAAALPQGVLGRVAVTSDQGSITTEADLTGLSVTVTVGTSRRIRVSTVVHLRAGGASVLGVARIKEGGTELTSRNSSDTSGIPQTSDDTMLMWVTLTPSAGSHTYKVTAARTSGGSAITSKASSTKPAELLVEDLGPA